VGHKHREQYFIGLNKVRENLMNKKSELLKQKFSKTIDFSFSLMLSVNEKIFVRHFEKMREKNSKKTKRQLWLFEKVLGKVFLVLGTK
jgi:hypothetical protein